MFSNLIGNPKLPFNVFVLDLVIGHLECIVDPWCWCLCADTPARIHKLICFSGAANLRLKGL